MKYIFYCLLLTVIFNKTVHSQISNENEFINFSLLSPQEKHMYISTKNWKGVGVDRKSENNKIIEDMVYSKNVNNFQYELSLRGIVDGNGNTTNITMLLLSDENTYNTWVKSWKKNGFVFKKDPNGSDKYMYMGDDYIIMLEKIIEDDITFYQISVL